MCACPDLLLPVEDSNNDEDEDAHSDQCDGRQQHAVARSQVQLSAPAKEGECENTKASSFLTVFFN